MGFNSGLKGLKYYNCNMIRPPFVHLQGVYINYIYETWILFKYIRVQLGSYNVTQLECCSRDINLIKYSICSSYYTCIGMQMYIS